MLIYYRKNCVEFLFVVRDTKRAKQHFYKNSELYFQKVNFTSDDGWIFDNKNEFTEYIFESTISDFASISYRNIGSTRAAFQLYSSKTLHKIERQYLLAKLGGVMQGLYLICFLFIF